MIEFRAPVKRSGGCYIRPLFCLRRTRRPRPPQRRHFVAQSHTPCNHCVRFGPRVAATPATLVTGRLATPYPDGTFTRWIAPASPGAPCGDPDIEQALELGDMGPG